MRVLLLFAAILFSSVHSQNAEPLYYIGEVSLPGQTAEEIFNKIERYVGANISLTLATQDAETGEISAIMFYPYVQSFLTGQELTKGFIQFEVTFACFDDHIFVEGKNFYHSSYSPGYTAGMIYDVDSWPDWSRMGKAWAARVYDDIKEQCFSATIAVAQDAIR